MTAPSAGRRRPTLPETVVRDILDRLHCEEGVPTRAPAGTIALPRRDDIAIRRLVDAAQVSDADTVGRAAQERLRAVLDDWLTDVSPHGLAATLAALGDDADRPCDAHGAAMVLARGINPFALLLTTLTLGGSCVVDIGEHRDMQVGIDLAPVADDPVDASWDGLTIGIAPGIWWMGDNVRLPKGSLPDTIGAAMTGRPLRELIAHPDLDGQDAVITRIDTTDAPWITVRVSRTTDVMSWRDAVDAA